MPKPSSLQIAKTDIRSFLNDSSLKVFSEAQLAHLLSQNRDVWQLAPSISVARFITFFVDEGEMQEHKFHSATYQRQIIRYSWGKVTPLELASSIKSGGYFSHGAALTLHGLATPNRLTYLNVEQSPKPKPLGSLTQEALGRAFSGQQRRSNLVYDHSEISVAIISGKNTNRLGVDKVIGPSSEIVEATNLERTLIDIIVRPAYSGGISTILEAYRKVIDKVRIDRMLDLLKKLDYVYPYHQAIGFLMQKANYPRQYTARLRSLGLNYDFYLVHGMHDPEYSGEWRLFYPKELSAL